MAHLAQTSVGLVARFTIGPASAMPPTVSRLSRPENDKSNASAITTIVIFERPWKEVGGALDPALTLDLLPVAILAYHGVLPVSDCGEEGSGCDIWSVFVR